MHGVIRLSVGEMKFGLLSGVSATQASRMGIECSENSLVLRHLLRQKGFDSHPRGCAVGVRVTQGCLGRDDEGGLRGMVQRLDRRRGFGRGWCSRHDYEIQMRGYRKAGVGESSWWLLCKRLRDQTD